MSKQVLIINVTRMGDLIQTVPLIKRLHHEWPDAAVDLIVDRTFAPVAALLPGLRHIHAYDFQGLTDDTRTMAKDVVSLCRELGAWLRPLAELGYDRVVNLTFNRRSGLLAASLGVRDTRGVTASGDGATIVRNPWLAYFADLHRYRRVNRFNLVDLYALGGSGPGPAASLTLAVEPSAAEWAGRFLQTSKADGCVVAVQVGASEAIKAWRPDYFGRTMAALSRRLDVTFVLIGTQAETAAAEDALAAYRAAGGLSRVIDAVGRTTLPQLVALLQSCRLMLTNDTGPMHLAVGAGTPVIDLSVGHVDFHETGPYGSGHWVIQPELACAPCGFDQICAHHACKDRLVPEEVASLCLYVLGHGPCPMRWNGVRVYESAMDTDGLVAYGLKGGCPAGAADWYGAFWRCFWYDTFTGRRSELTLEAPPDFDTQEKLFEPLRREVQDMVTQSESILDMVRRHPLRAGALQSGQAQLTERRQRTIARALGSPAFEPVTIAFVRELSTSESMDLVEMAEQQTAAYRTWYRRLMTVMQRLRECAGRRKTAAALHVLHS